MKLLVVEDEALLRHHLQTRLTESGHVVESVANAEEALYQTGQFNFDLAVIDLGLPGMGGLDLIRQLRSGGKTFPILILTARGNWQDKVEGLAAGADDYVVKPFQFEELDARLNALLRRSSGFTQSTIVAGPLLLDLNRKQATLDEQPLALTAYEYRILEYLMRHHQQVVPKDRLMEHSTRTTTSAIRTLLKCWSAACAANSKARPGSNRSTPCAASATCSMSAALDSFSSCSLDARRHHVGGVVHARLAAGDARRVQPALQDSIEQRLASDVTTLISAARIENGRLVMPNQLPDERFNLTDFRLLGYIYDREGHLVWRSKATQEEQINYKPRYDGLGNEFARIRETNGQEFFVYDVEVKLLGGKSAAFSIVALQPVREYETTLEGLRENLYLGFGAALLVLLALLWIGLTWGLKALAPTQSGTRPDRRRHPRKSH